MIKAIQFIALLLAIWKMHTVYLSILAFIHLTSFYVNYVTTIIGQKNVPIFDLELTENMFGKKKL